MAFQPFLHDSTRPEASTGTPGRPANQLVFLAVAMVLGMMPWFAATVAGGAMAAEWHAGPAFQSWLTMAVQLGFVTGTLVSAIFLLSDRLSSRRLAAVSAAIAAVTTAFVAVPGISPGMGLVLRAATGAALAGVYPPGMKIAAGWWRERRGMAIGVLVGALTLGSASPNLVRFVAPGLDWRNVMLVAATGAAISAALFLILIRTGPHETRGQKIDWHGLLAVVRNRGVRLATGGYLGHMWELYAMWAAMGGFWSFIAERRGLAPGLGPALAFVTIGSGAVGSYLAGIFADRWGRPAITIVAMALSGSCCLWIGGLIDGPLGLLVAISLLWGITIVADSAQFSAAVTELAPQSYIGTALTLQTCLGFLLTMVSIRLVPMWVAAWGWQKAFMPLAVGPALGILSMRALRGATTGRPRR